MLIDRQACTGCGRCVPYCPMEAIIWHKGKKGLKPYSAIERDECVECGVCYRANVCSADAISEEELDWPRVLRKAFSDPLYIHEGTDVPGRGTEEMKTNDVTGRFWDGTIGVGMEMGRPGTGVRLEEAEKVIRRLVGMGIELEPLNPLSQLIEDQKTGALRSDVLKEKVLSAIVEFRVAIGRAQEVFSEIKRLAGEIDTVFSLDLICKVSPAGEIPIIGEIERAGLPRSINGKMNVGLGRPLYRA